MRDAVTFGLAYAGYVLLGLNVALYAWQRPRRTLTCLLAIVVLSHVALVWMWRFEWSATYAWEKSWVGFVIFHGALALILAATLAPRRWVPRLIFAAFPVVTAGAAGAVFRYDVVSGYQVPLFTACFLTLAAGGIGFCKLGKGRQL